MPASSTQAKPEPLNHLMVKVALEGWAFHHALKNSAFLIAKEDEEPLVAKDWNEHHLVLQQFRAEQANETLILSETCHRGHILYHGQAGEVQIYTWNPEKTLFLVSRSYRYKRASGDFTADSKWMHYFTKKEDAEAFIEQTERTDGHVGGDTSYRYQCTEIRKGLPKAKEPAGSAEPQPVTDASLTQKPDRNHPLWEEFKNYNRTHQCGIPDLDDKGDELLFQTYIQGFIRGRKPTGNPGKNAKAYLVRFEDGTYKHTDNLSEDLSAGELSGVLEITDISDPQKPKTILDGKPQDINPLHAPTA